MKLALGLFVSTTMLVGSDGRPAFVSRIPNGNGVAGFAALGHVSASGGGSLNAFGRAFNAAGRGWTKELCQQDSDNDGATNGEELGDPCCTWRAAAGFGSSSTTATFPTHPGIANRFTADELAVMACGGEADVGLTDSSGSVTASALSTTVDGSNSAALDLPVGDTNTSSNSNGSGSIDEQVKSDNTPSISPKTAQPSNASSAASFRSFQAVWFVVSAGHLALSMR